MAGIIIHITHNRSTYLVLYWWLTNLRRIMIIYDLVGTKRWSFSQCCFSIRNLFCDRSCQQMNISWPPWCIQNNRKITVHVITVCLDGIHCWRYVYDVMLTTCKRLSNTIHVTIVYVLRENWIVRFAFVVICCKLRHYVITLCDHTAYCSHTY